MKTKIAITSLGALLFAGMLSAQSTASPSSSQSPQTDRMHKGGKHGDHDPGKHLDELSEKLNLTVDQKSQVRDMFKSQHDQAEAIHQDSSLTKDQQKAKMKELRDATHAKMNGILTPEQQQKFAAMRKEHEHGERRHKGDKSNGTAQPKSQG